MPINLSVPFQGEALAPLSSMGIDLRAISSENRKEQISRIATQFEEMLLHTLIKDTFKSPSLFGDETPWMSTMSSLQPMLMSQYLAEQGGLGYRRIIEEQILEKIRQVSPEGNLDIDKGTVSLRFTPNQPLSGPLSSPFGWRKDPFTGNEAFHSGIDIAVPCGTPVRSIGPGEVIFSGEKPGYGSLVEIDHGNGLISRYGHNQKNMVKTGDLVSQETVIAHSGMSGRSTGPHLHLEIRHQGRPVDPASILQSV